MRRDISRILINPNTKIKDIIEVIDRGALGIALVVNEENNLLGTITDGDIRRAIINEISFEEKAEKIMNANYIFVHQNTSLKFISKLFEMKQIKQIPILDDDGQVVDIILINDILKKNGVENWAVIMAGGLGTRLRPLTYEVPKPMIKVGNKPILETIINQLSYHGFKNILISVNYKGQIIENYFRDGSNFDVNIEYIYEKKRLGTAGALKLAKHYLDKPFVMMNGDLLTKVNFKELLEYHNKNSLDITIGTKKYDIEIPYGVIETDGIEVKSLREKPKIDFFINGGIYCINPAVIEFIPDNQYYDITELINKLLIEKFDVGSFPIREYWLDIGQMPDYERAVIDYYDIFGGEVCATKE
ncbi:CBS domain-containing protein [Crassaminicella thermophila]|uniref:CBS domain-containing protein n=1 Tax=Crassaminicella thermophila TaxID=2599308 RepID=A0A5C0SEB8_CRATE|nr:nucleotidyltransferase family protein [Crassaminicella thermophila]QEK11319.1 CBS domain-containing protein [Crassaminicella thermophila]